MLRVLAFLPYPTGRVPGQRYRIEQWAPRLVNEGVAVTFLPFLSGRGMDVLHRTGHTTVKIRETLSGYWRRSSHLRQLGSCDLVFLFREAALLGPPLFEHWMTCKRPLVLDFDDAIYLRPANAPNRWAARLRPSGKTASICRIAAHVTVGNENLAAFARAHSPAVSVVPSTIDTDEYVRRERPPNATPVVGWSGSVSTLPYLTMLRETLLSLRRRLFFKLRVIGGDVAMEGLNIECLPWSADTEVEDLRPIDVGLMPLPDDLWARGKCGLKALQYMALGIPPVVAPVGVNREIVQDGVNGFHASSGPEWVEKIQLLLSNEELRRRLGAAARRTVENRYSAGVWAPRIARIFRGVATGG